MLPHVWGKRCRGDRAGQGLDPTGARGAFHHVQPAGAFGLLSPWHLLPRGGGVQVPLVRLPSLRIGADEQDGGRGQTARPRPVSRALCHSPCKCCDECQAHPRKPREGRACGDHASWHRHHALGQGSILQAGDCRRHQPKRRGHGRVSEPEAGHDGCLRRGSAHRGGAQLRLSQPF